MLKGASRVTRRGMVNTTEKTDRAVVRPRQGQGEQELRKPTAVVFYHTEGWGLG